MVELECDAIGKIEDIHWSHVNLDGLSADERAEVEQAAIELRRRRVASAKKRHKIGRNEPCPCGSGKKYKKCCLV